MRNLIFENYKTRLSKSCLISAFSNLFINSNANIDESDIFFIGNELDLTFEWQDNTQLSEMKIFYDSDKMICNFFEKFNENIYMYTAPHTNLNLYKSFIAKKIDDGIPIFADIYTKNVPYYPIKPKSYRSHALTIIGYDNENAIVSDCLIPGIKTEYDTYLGPISFLDLYNIASNQDYLIYEFEYKSAIDKLKKYKAIDSLNCFCQSLWKFYHNDKYKFYSFAEKINNFSKEYSKKEILDWSEEVFFHIKYNGICYSKNLILEHYKKLCNQTSIDCKKEITDELIRSANEWNVINYSLLKANINTKPDDKYLKISDYIYQRSNHDAEIYKKIYDEFSTI